jgi:hypothetical protein
MANHILMKGRHKTFFLVLVTMLVSGLSSCIQTRTLSTDNQLLSDLNRPDYIGTFASVYFVDESKHVNIDPLQTLVSIHRNDSIIRRRVKRIAFANQQFDTLSSISINEELISVLNYVKVKQTVKGFKSSAIMDEIGKTTISNFNIYFISTGFMKDSILAGNEAERKAMMTSLAVLSAFAFGAAGVLVYGNVAKGSNRYVVPANALTYKEAFEGKQGLTGFVIVYDKSKKEICYVREQFFASSKDPVNVNAIRRQIKHAFKELYF